MPTVREAAASHWTAVAIGVVIVAVHAWWLSRSDHVGEVVSGFGAALVVLGIWIAARPYIRSGLQSAISAGLPPYAAAPFGSDEMMAAHQQQVARLRPGVVLDVWAERIVAVGVIVIGTLLNGYGTPIARALGMKI